MCLSILFTLLILFAINATCQEDTTDKCQPSSKPLILQTVAGRLQTHYTPGFLRGQYRPGLDCHYIIKASSYISRVQLFIHESRMEDRLFTDCDDFMEVRDGSRNDSTLMVRWCGYTNPLTLTSTTDSLYIRFKTDLFYENKGVNWSYTEYIVPGCPASWIVSSSQMMCYRLVTPKPNVTWVQAQYHCNYEKSNLLTISSLEEYQIVYKAFSLSKEYPWIGLTDAQEEGKFVNVDHSTSIWPNLCDTIDAHGLCFPLFVGHEDKDCLFLDFNQEASLYKVDDCRVERPFICKKRIDGTTVPYPPPEAAIKQGTFAPVSASFNPAILVLIIIALVLIFLIFMATYVKKRLKRTTKVNVLEHDNGALITNADPKSDPSNPQEADLGVKVKPKEAFGDNLANDDNALRKIIIPVSTKNGHINGNIPSTNGHVANGYGPKVFTLPPIDKFDRPPPNCLLDNVSSISLDEFWQRLESEKFRHSYPTKTPPK